ncbi:aminoglycoside phosphotransferase [Actinoplanes sp. NEAU-A11]|uniref:Aminoglycoside phosphotransferase n=2 Tax=Actinoplanes aureus TaxID=2792083 RepID=A0A931G4S2_9ACTN|nr:aminoglycoside phosphotransferase [Actinoplanes aureus]
MAGGDVVRPRLAEAPRQVRAVVEEALGESVQFERPAAAGFTPSIASAVTGGSGRSVFVKAAPTGGGLGEAVRTGVQLAPLIGDLSPRLLTAEEPEGWVVAVYEHVPGSTAAQWDESAVAAMLDVLAVIQKRLAGPPLPGTIRYADAFAPMLGAWRSLARRPGGDASTVAHLRDIELPVPIAVDLLAELEEQWFPALGPGDAMQHGDLRRDNVIRYAADDGLRLWVVDWTHAWTGPGWMDLVRLAPDMAVSGHDPEAVLRRSCWADADPHAVNAALAGLAGRAWRDGHLPGPPALRRMQLQQAVPTLAWLGRRLGIRL